MFVLDQPYQYLTSYGRINKLSKNWTCFKVKKKFTNAIFTPDNNSLFASTVFQKYSSFFQSECKKTHFLQTQKYR